MEEPIAHAYRRMATEANYRPGAPSDGVGNITGPLNLAREIEIYTERWRRDEDAQIFRVGCASFKDRETLIFIVEAARELCGVNHEIAAQLLRMAVANLDAR
jgi:hypothetical protein